MQVHSSILSQEQSDVQIWDVKKKKNLQRRIWDNCESQAEQKSEELRLPWEKQTPYWDV